MKSYNAEISSCADTIASNGDKWRAIDAEYVARMKLQNRFNTGLDIAKYLSLIHI